MSKFKSILCLILVCVCMLMVSNGCHTKEKDIERIKDLEFTVVPDENVPQELMKIIEEKKESPFKLKFTSTDNEYLYIVVGYGTQNTGGYSISVDDFYLASNAIYIDTNLIGPTKDEVVTTALTYPYVVVKTPFRDESVVFQ
ncbi:MAG: protease complex subunit PrcB family protein [bacterium]|nr:protease complex subunit PrcB family protein [bacterium]